MTKSPLEPFGNPKDDLFFWIKSYLSSRMFVLAVDDGFTISFNKTANSERIARASSYEELYEAVKDIRRNGLKNFGIYFASVLSLYRFVQGDKKIESIKEIDTEYRNGYFKKNPDNLSPGTRRSYLGQIGGLMKFIEEANEESFTFNIDNAVTPIDDEKRDMPYLTTDELTRFFDALEKYPVQSRVMMKIACYGALRSEELVSLKTKQITFIENPSPLIEKGLYMAIEVIGKGKKKRTTYIKAPLIQKDYDAYVLERRCSGDFIFCNQNGERYDHRSANSILSRILKAAGITKSGIQMLRRSYSALLITEGVDFASISELLGHEWEDLGELFVTLTRDGLRKIVK